MTVLVPPELPIEILDLHAVLILRETAHFKAGRKAVILLNHALQAMSAGRVQCDARYHEKFELLLFCVKTRAQVAASAV